MRKLDLVDMRKADKWIYRANFMSAATARSSDSRMERQNPSSSSARTLVVLHGPSFSENNTRRVSLRYGKITKPSIEDGTDGIRQGEVAKANRSLTNRKLPKSDPAAQLSHNVPSSVPLSM